MKKQVRSKRQLSWMNLLPMVFSLLACGTNSGAKKNAGLQPDTKAGQALALLDRPLELRTLTFSAGIGSINWPAVPLTNEFRAEKGPDDAVIGFRFATKDPATLSILSYLSRFRCRSERGQPLGADFALYRLKEQGKLDLRLATLDSTSQVKLSPGVYAVTFYFPTNSNCSDVAIGFEASLMRSGS